MEKAARNGERKPPRDARALICATLAFCIAYRRMDAHTHTNSHRHTNKTFSSHYLMCGGGRTQTRRRVDRMLCEAGVCSVTAVNSADLDVAYFCKAICCVHCLMLALHQLAVCVCVCAKRVDSRVFTGFARCCFLCVVVAAICLYIATAAINARGRACLPANNLMIDIVCAHTLLSHIHSIPRE